MVQALRTDIKEQKTNKFTIYDDYVGGIRLMEEVITDSCVTQCIGGEDGIVDITTNESITHIDGQVNVDKHFNRYEILTYRY